MSFYVALELGDIGRLTIQEYSNYLTQGSEELGRECEYDPGGGGG